MTGAVGDVLALDLARRFGWCEGAPGAIPRSGSVDLVPPGASDAAAFAALQRWLAARFAVARPYAVIFEAPLPPSFARGRTNRSTTYRLFGYPAVTEAACELMGVYRVRQAAVSDVRRHFIGSNPRGDVGKRQTMDQCRALGLDPRDDNEADAIALWHYQCALVSPASSFASTPLAASADAHAGDPPSPPAAPVLPEIEI